MAQAEVTTNGAGSMAKAQALTPADEVAAREAARLFIEQGIANVRMTDIAEASGVGVATLYRHFQTKVGIALAGASLLWGDLNEQLAKLVESDVFLELDGASRLEELFRGYCAAYVGSRGFVAFLDELDNLVLSEGVDEGTLSRYGGKIDSFYLIFEDAYLMGRADGSIVREVDFPVFYRAVAHALMGVAGKLVRGEVIPSDDFSEARGAAELACLVDMAVTSLRAEYSSRAETTQAPPGG